VGRPRYRLRPAYFAIVVLAACWTGALVHGQLAFEAFEVDHPAIGYHRDAPTDAVARLNQRLEAGEQQLRFDGAGGYLRSLLAALAIPVESQMAVYSQTSLQRARVSPQNPRVIFFNDSTAVAWVPGGFIEVASHDPRQGAVFYTLQQIPAAVPQLVREDRCLTCHLSSAAEGIPGFFIRSIPTAVGGATMPWLGNITTDHRTPLPERWGGWYVTGNHVPGPHLGNALIANADARELPPWDANRNVMTLKGRIDTETYLSPYSDIVALLVFEHQAHMMNLLTRIGWEARVLAHESSPRSATALRAIAEEVVDYFLFADEVPLNGVRGASGFAERFTGKGPRDRMGRSLRDLDLQERLLRYPFSYMIYSGAFDALPAAAKNAIYRRAWEVLSGEERAQKYLRLSREDRRAILEILRDTKRGLPDYFLQVFRFQ